MRRTLRVSAAAVAGALTVTLTAAVLVGVSGSGTATMAAATSVSPSAVRPGYPFLPAGAGESASPAFASALTANSVLTATSTNWAGYAASYGTTTFRSVSAHFTVPYLDCKGVTATNGAWSSHWVGLDGLTSLTVEQTGVDARCDGGSPIYEAWWEMFPNGMHLVSIAVHPGNAINMSVNYSSSTHAFTLTLSNTTTGQKFTHKASCPSGSTCVRNSAEVISEAPALTSGGGFTIMPLADFQAVNFANVHITNTSGTHSGGLQSAFWNTYRITQVSDGSSQDITGQAIAPGTALDRTTPLYRKNAFLDYWMPANAG
ncbi:MAG TPA: G1 family glutamic endopeptidase [Streptosporangiaceae bacterium]